MNFLTKPLLESDFVMTTKVAAHEIIYQLMKLSISYKSFKFISCTEL